MVSERTKSLLTEENKRYLKNYLTELSSQFTGMIPAADVQKLCTELNVTVYELMIMLIAIPSLFAVVPISNYPVGAFCLGESGNIYYGANMEFTNQALSFVVHGEQASIANAIEHGETKAVALAVSAAPCGYCRQFLYEINNAQHLEIILDGKPNQLLTYYLPDAFGPGDLGFTGGLMDVKYNNLSLVNPTSDPVILEALNQANKSYAIYTSCFCGVAIQVTDGSIYGGSYAENAAYNPSMSPLEAALVTLVMNGSNFSFISRIVLVEAEGSKESQLSATTAVASSVSPSISLEYYRATVI